MTGKYDPCLREKNEQRPTLIGQILELTDKEFEASIMSVLKDIKENMLLMNEKKGKHQQKNGNSSKTRTATKHKTRQTQTPNNN